MSGFLASLPGACAQGIIWGIMAVGVYLTFKVLDLADLTVDGGFGTGGAVLVVCTIAGMNIWLAMPAGVLGRVYCRTGYRYFAYQVWHTGDLGRYFDPAGAVFRKPADYERSCQCGAEY